MITNTTDKFVRQVLIANGIGDIIVALMMLFVPQKLIAFINLTDGLEVLYLSGGWGVAALTFGFLRLFAGLHPNREICWFTAIFGVLEGSALTAFGLFLWLTTELSFFQISLSTLFAFFFLIAYCVAFLKQWKKP
jgi:hypothetical protein